MLQLSYREAKPIYEQVKDNIRRLVITGALCSGEKLPSIRELAARFSINPNTISKAYRELEEEGYIYSVSGKGTFVADNTNVMDLRIDMLLGSFNELVSELKYLDVSSDELKKRIDEVKIQND